MAITAPVPPLKDLLAQLIRRYGAKTKKAFGDDVGLNGSTVSHLLSGDPHYVLGVESCLRIARATGEAPSIILRSAGKGEIADLLEELYGKSSGRAARKGVQLSADEQRVIRELRSLDEKARRAWMVILSEVATTRLLAGRRRRVS